MFLIPFIASLTSAVAIPVPEVADIRAREADTRIVGSVSNNYA
jgi:hypothetical protein